MDTSKGAKLLCPSFLKNKRQLSLSEVMYSKYVSNVRIHVERVIKMLKRFDVLHTIVPITFIKHMDNVIMQYVLP